jgi:hypothetical protein
MVLKMTQLLFVAIAIVRRFCSVPPAVHVAASRGGAPREPSFAPFILHRALTRRNCMMVFSFEKPYHVVRSDDLSGEAIIVLREALKQTRKIGIG